MASSSAAAEAAAPSPPSLVVDPNAPVSLRKQAPAGSSAAQEPARKSAGGKAPVKQLATKAARKAAAPYVGSGRTKQTARKAAPLATKPARKSAPATGEVRARKSAPGLYCPYDKGDDEAVEGIWTPLLPKVLRQVHPSLTISDAAVEAVHTRLMSTVEAVVAGAAALADGGPLGVENVGAAMRSVLPGHSTSSGGELAKHAASEGNKAAKFYPPGPEHKDNSGLTFSVVDMAALVATRLTSEQLPLPDEVAAYLTAMTEYLAAEILELAGNAPNIRCGHVMRKQVEKAVRADEELSLLYPQSTGAGAS